jgi:hypothetical protein
VHESGFFKIFLVGAENKASMEKIIFTRVAEDLSE